MLKFKALPVDEGLTGKLETLRLEKGRGLVRPVDDKGKEFFMLEAIDQENQSSSADQDEQKGGQKKKRRGFAGMDPGRQREIARQGGRAAHEKGTAHEFTSEEAAEAGRKGGLNRGKSRNRQSEGEGGPPQGGQASET